MAAKTKTTKKKRWKAGRRLGYKCPTGKVIGWKWGYWDDALTGRRAEALIKLLIPASADIVRPRDSYRRPKWARKYRTSEAKVLGIWNAGNGVVGAPIDEAMAQRACVFVYRVGETVTPDAPFNADIERDCASGIHFFRTRKIALEFDTQ